MPTGRALLEPGPLQRRHPVGVAARRDRASDGYKDDYIAHHEPFQYYASTANPHHLPPAVAARAIGSDTQTHVQRRAAVRHRQPPYDTSDFDELVAAIRHGQLPASALPAVSFLKAPGYQDGHAAYSDPADEQAFVVHEINALEQTPDWSSTAVIVSYDDSDGWYDHAYSGVTNPSLSPADNLTNTDVSARPTRRRSSAAEAADRPAARRPAGPLRASARACRCCVVSPCAKQNAVDHNLSDQSSIINFVEYNWHLPAIKGSFDQALQATDAKEGIPFDLAGLFDFTSCSASPLILDPATGRIDVRSTPSTAGTCGASTGPESRPRVSTSAARTCRARSSRTAT